MTSTKMFAFIHASSPNKSMFEKLFSLISLFLMMSVCLSFRLRHFFNE